MQDAMTIWDSICHSQWFKKTSIVRRIFPRLLIGLFTFLFLVSQILFLNKNDIFHRKIPVSNIKTFFPVSLVVRIDPL